MKSGYLYLISVNILKATPIIKIINNLWLMAIFSKDKPQQDFNYKQFFKINLFYHLYF
jgi:hypothetical protein